MPWQIKKSGSKWCVYKKGSSSPVPGGCHSSKTDALKHMRALYVNVKSQAGDFAVEEVFASALAPQEGVTTEGVQVSFVTIPNVPLATTGIEYALMTGPATFTAEDVADAVKAIGDPHIQPPKLKLGYLNAEHGPVNVIAEPAFGRIENVKLGDNNQTVYGDIIVPEWLAEILPVAYPNRSFEGNRNVTTAGGNTYRLVINAVTLLGVKLPGISALPDLPMYFGATPPPGLQVDLAAAVNAEDVRRRYYEELDKTDAEANSSEHSMWWVRHLYIDDAGGYLIVDDDKGHLYQVNFAVSGADVSYQDPVEVRMDFEPVAATKEDRQRYTNAVEHALRIVAGEKIAASYSSRADSRAGTVKGGTTLDLKELAKKLGMPEDSTQEQVDQKLAQLTAPGAGAPATVTPATNPGSGQSGTGTGTATPEGTTGPSPETGTPTGTPTNPGGAIVTPPPDPTQGTEQASGDSVTMDRATFNQLVAGLQRVNEREQKTMASENERLLRDALHKGKIPPVSHDYYKGQLDNEATRAATIALLASLPENSVPVALRSSGGNNGDNQTVEAEGLPDEWFPTVNFRERRELAASGWRRVTQAKES